MHTIGGMQIYVNDAVCAGKPRMKLRDIPCVTDDFRAEINEWLRNFFGHESDTVYRGIDPASGAQTVVMSSRDFKKLKERTQNDS